MKTIYTDNYGFYPWAMLFASLVMFGSAYGGFTSGDGFQLGAGICSGVLFLFVALKRFSGARQAKLKGTDPAIIRIKE